MEMFGFFFQIKIGSVLVLNKCAVSSVLETQTRVALRHCI